ncbi:DUF2199 domain-containing protein [Priestia filamentosa]|uniref:DUF2199 domain-containing protein n=1 Tax=Priestia filamentosa TaxID=1402861 RepID=UPI000E759063|nr:DUF2199 domain-containing protein [Priestia filamentosa]RJS62751.1 hypothetical protein CJ485_25530 [Priestia filamentosa]
MRRRRSYRKSTKEQVNYKNFNCHHSIAELPMSYGSDAPCHYYNTLERARENRFELYPEICVMDQQHFFVRGCLEIPVLDSKETFIWDVWVSLSEENFGRTIHLWEREEREQEPPYFGWLSTFIPGYPDTVNLKTNVHTRSIGRRPFIELEPTDHPLAIEQREGISLERIAEIKEIITKYNEEDLES